MKARVKFSKMGSMRLIGHLDVMRYFQKAFRRAGIDVSYSQGFSPHPLMSFASPLGLGLSSEGEYLDLQLEEWMEKETLLQKINAQMNEEIRVTDFLYLEEESKASMAVLAACDYLILLRPGKSSPFADSIRRKEILQKFLENKTVEILKKTKRSEKILDIKEYIYLLTDEKQSFETFTEQTDRKSLYEAADSFPEEYRHMPLFYLQLTAGSVVNIKPELVLQAICEKEALPYEPFAYQVHRLEMYGDVKMKKGEVHTRTSEPPCELVPLSAFGKRKTEK